MKRRSDSFFGLHFDFHASPAGAAGAPVGGTLREEDIREICELLHPDFLQIDCKGHPGWASYPTACGNAMPAFAGDPLEKWRRVTKEEDVALYMHYSGVIDRKYVAEHPEEAVLNADGTRDSASTRTMGHYADDLLIPQLSELAGQYGVDGVWVDGDCWGSKADFDPETVAAFEKETGIALGGKLPAKPGDAYYEEYRAFCRELFRRYVRHYTDTLHARYPHFQVASNWSFTDHMPEEVSAGVDFLSGDLNPWDSFNSARYAGRAIASQGRTWDLMSWNFRNGLAGKEGHAVKHPNQIIQEAAAVIALGGGFQNYITQRADGAPRMEQIRAMKPLEAFMRAREPYCFRGKLRHQAVLLLSTEDRHHESASLYSRNGCEKIMGLTALLCDAGTSLEIAEEHTLRGHYADYPLIIVPELFHGLRPETEKELLTYAAAGGSLLLVGAHTAELFSAAGAPFTPGEKQHEGMSLFTLNGREFGSIYQALPIAFAEGETVSEMTAAAEAPGKPLAAVLPYGKGRIAVAAFDLGTAYQEAAQYLHLELITALTDKLYQPLVKVEEAEGMVEIVDLEKNGKLYIQLVNANGSHKSTNIATEANIPPCRGVKLALRLEKKPEALILQPEGKPLAFTYGDGTARVTVDKVPFHEIIEVKF